MKTGTKIALGVAGVAAVGGVAVLVARRRGAEDTPEADTPAPTPGAVRMANPGPEGWEASLTGGYDGALDRCLREPKVISRDQAVLYILEVVYPGAVAASGSPGRPDWLDNARGVVETSLDDHLGSSEVEARARLSAVGGLDVLRASGSLDEAVASMARSAFPHARWDGPLQPWQRQFYEEASSVLRAA